MREYIKHLYRDTTIGHLLISPFKKLYEIYGSYILPENVYIRRKFKSRLGYNLNLDNPKTFNEKIHWLQKNDRTPLHTLCTDKYAVREYVKEKIGEEYLIPLVLHTTNPKDIVPENLPDYPFIIKTNHGCGGHVMVRDKSKIEWKSVQKDLRRLLSSNYYYRAGEWQYKDIKPCIIVEKLLLDKNSNIPFDYKFQCCNGGVEWIEVIMDRYTDSKINFYNLDWNIIDYIGKSFKPGKDFKKPEKLTKMKSLAETLASDFHYARVDLYYFGSKIYFGELTFSPSGGFAPFIPQKWDRKFGDKLKL